MSYFLVMTLEGRDIDKAEVMLCACIGALHLAYTLGKAPGTYISNVSMGLHSPRGRVSF